MNTTEPGQRRPAFTLTAAALTQLLAAFACFLGAFVLPHTFPELRGVSTRVMIVLGVLMLILGIGNIIFGQRLGRVLSRVGKRSRVAIPREGIGFLAIMLTLAVGALMGHRNMPLLVFGMMAGPFVLNGWIVYRMLKDVTVTRHAPRRAQAGEFVAVEMEIHNGKRKLASRMLEVHDRITGKGLGERRRDDEAVVTFVRVPAQQTRTGRYQLKLSQRGLYKIGPARISSRFPMGIGERGQMHNTTSELIVHPQLGQLLPEWSRQQKELSEASQRVHSRQGIFDDEFHRIREYRSDDNPRSIHWRSTARRGELMIREYQQNRHSDSLLILDLPDLKTWSLADSEMAISLAATICAEQTRTSSGGKYLLGISGAKPTLISSRSPGGFREEALDALAVCRRTDSADLNALLKMLLDEYTIHDERLILITPRPEEADDAMRYATSQLTNDNIDLRGLTTVVEANRTRMETVIRLADTENRAGGANASPTGRFGEAEASA